MKLTFSAIKYEISSSAGLSLCGIIFRRLDLQKKNPNLSTANSSCSLVPKTSHHRLLIYQISAQNSSAASREKVWEVCGKKTFNISRFSVIRLSTEVSTSMEIMEIFWLRDQVKCPHHGEMRAQQCLWFAYCILRHVMFTPRVPKREWSVNWKHEATMER